jgi:hypothetical protein
LLVVAVELSLSSLLQAVSAAAPSSTHPIEAIIFNFI